MDPIFFIKGRDRTPDLLADRQKVRGSHIILVEGQDDLWFFDRLLSDMNADKEIVQTIDYGGCGELDRFLTSLFKSNEVLDSDITGLLITGDADTFIGKLPYKVKKACQQGNVPEPEHGKVVRDPTKLISKVGLFLVPHPGSGGSLETLLLETVAGSAPANEARTFVQNHHADKAPKNDKRVAQAFLATQAELSRGAGIGANKGYFDLNHAALQNLKDIVVDFLS